MNSKYKDKQINLPAKYMLDQIIESDRYKDLVFKAAQNIVKRLRTRSVFVGEKHEQLIGDLCRVVINPWKDEHCIVVHPGECGFGKTTAMIEIVKVIADASPEVGIVIAVERISDMKRMEQELDGRAISFFSFYADSCLQGLTEYNRHACSECKYFCEKKRARKEHSKYQVLLVSHEHLLMRALYGDGFGELAYFMDENGVRQKRSLLLIDEKPQISLNQNLSEKELYTLRQFLMKIGPESPLYGEAKQIERYIYEANFVVGDLKDDYKIIDSFDPAFQLSDEMKKYYFQTYDGDDFAVLGLLASFIRKGGVVQYKEFSSRWHGPGKIFTADILHPDFGMKTIIFDATAGIDLDYQDKRYRILDVPRIRSFSSLAFNNCPDANLSRSKLASKKKIIDPESLIYDIINDNHGEMLILTYKGQEGRFLTILEDKRFNADMKIYVDHYGNIKGKYQYDNANQILLYGLNHKSDVYYVAKALSHGIRVDFVKASPTKQYGRVYQHQGLQAIFESEIATDLIQGIMRTKLRRNTMEPVKVYSFIQYRRVMIILQEYFSECTKAEWYPLSFCMKYMGNGKNREKRICGLVAYLERFFHVAEIGTCISKEQINQALKYKDQDTLGADLKNEFVLSVLKRLGVSVGHHKLIKNERGWSHDKDNTNQKQVC
ncbi:MAG: hypothetical protein ACM3TR_12745 [Caulobacteraceae bacterium]